MSFPSYADNSAYEAVTDLIYEAAVLPDGWPIVLERLAQISGAVGGVLIARSGPSLRVSGSSQEFLDVAKSYFTAFPGENERLVRLLARGRNGFIQDRDVFSAEEISREPIFQNFLIPRGLGQGVATVVTMPTGDDLILHLERRFSPIPVPRELIGRLDMLRPHVARAATVASRITFESSRAAVEVLNWLAIPAAAITQTGEVIAMNQAFEQERDVWMMRFRDRIALKDSAADRLLGAAIQELAGNAASRSIPITRDGGPSVLHMVPIRRDVNDIFARTSALVVLTRTNRRTAPPDSILQALFELTAAEAAVAQKLAEGLSPNQIAASTGRSIETIRNQIKRILTKTGSSRQSDLTGMMAALANGAAHGGNTQ